MTDIQTLRKTALASRRKLDANDRSLRSDLICKRLVRSREFHAATSIGCYLPMRDEVDTRIVIERAWRANKRIFVPVLRSGGKMRFREIRPNTTLHPNQLAIWEPENGADVSARQLQLVITPLVAFDESMHRIGMGGGYYDRCFAFLRHRKSWLRPKLLGVAFNCQKVEKISPNPWDIRLYRVFCE